MAFSPVQASKTITEQYKRYLSTIFRISDPDYEKQFLDHLRIPSMFAAGPFLDASDTFAKAFSPRDMVKQGVLPDGFLKLGFEHDRPFYSHQYEAIQRIISGQNAVLSTGTGSGKTESFLIPILACIMRELEQGTLYSGVRAILIYPMNALANDQIERLRTVLHDCPQITFGCYTGQTKEKFSTALHEYRKLNNGTEPIASELISREQMKRTPPHILVTNYAMLEYLMVRPQDAVFFHGDTWRFIVLDEAHVYRGSTGIEVSMLLRRLKAALPGCSMQYILTSATLGDENENDDVARFAQELCNSVFTADSVIRAKRVPVPLPSEPLDVPISFYEMVVSMREQGVSDEAMGDKILRCYPDWALKPDAPLFDAVHRDKRYWHLRSEMGEPINFFELSKRLGICTDELEKVIAVAACLEDDGIRLLDARYHMFLRATESVFITLPPSRHLFLTRRETFIENNGQSFTVFEIYTCNMCHAIYLIGKIENDCLKQCSGDEKRELFYLGGSISDTDEDCLLNDEGAKGDSYMLCAICGFVYRKNMRDAVKCEHGIEYRVPVMRIKVAGGGLELKKCVACEAVNAAGILRSFFTGQEAVTSVIATSLYNVLPEYRMETCVAAPIEDDFGFGERFAPTETRKVRQAKQFLCFSDSRQASAYFATYMDITYRQLLYKRLINECLHGQREPVTMAHFCEDLSAVFTQYGILDTDMRQLKESWKAVLAEAVDMGSGRSLFATGIMAIGIDSSMVRANSTLKLSQDDMVTLMNVLILSIMNDAAIFCPIAMTEEDKSFYAYSTLPCQYVLSGRDTKRNIRGFVPARANLSNKRLDYLERVLSAVNPDFPEDKLRKLLEFIWKQMIDAFHLLVPQGEGYQLDANRLMVYKPIGWYRCSKCKRLTPFAISRVCPTYRCDGRLENAIPETELADNHYYRIYHDMELRSLRIREHTAQLDRDTAYRYQQEFKDKRLDVLSCSTTFEMGVDVGSLETIFMRNVPPMPSNYAQRAGRAGRNKRSAAFALTFCNRSNHDFMFFNMPLDMIRGQIHAPHFNILNEKIAIRHLYASALSYFWKEHPELFSTVGRFLDNAEHDDSITDGVSMLRDYLFGKPEGLKRYMKRFLPGELYKKFDCENYGWVSGLTGDAPEKQGKLVIAMEEYTYEVGRLKAAIKEAFEAHRSTGFFEQRIRNYEREDILGFLSRQNVMPQYGFPVDTVSLQVDGFKNESHYGVELQRDLAIAIAEYAPGSQVVANGTLFVGRYIKKIPNIGWKMYDYAECPTCETLNIDTSTGGRNERLALCRVCNNPLHGLPQKTFLVPSFGFEADPNDVRKPGLIRPRRTYRGDIAYVGYRGNATEKEIKLSNAIISVLYCSQDEMAVLNKSDFYVCEACGYAEICQIAAPWTRIEHKMPSGRPCRHNSMRRLSLGYRFETDVLQLRFLTPALGKENRDQALGVLYGLLRGIGKILDLEERDMDGCLQCFLNPYSHIYSYGFVLYDTTPGGAGHVKRLIDAALLKSAIEETHRMMQHCHCGGNEGDSSCYSCLRSYRNQRVHDQLKRVDVISFLNRVFS